ncbi:MAG: hypothetical protein PF481_10515 [Bacteroidales bacterium]|jgi:hypothetical protein|nr:hypothetical protein [Bacteroidales bacterium]
MKQLITYIFALTIVVNFVSCEKEDPVGPDIVDLYGGFKILDSLSIPSATIDFSTTDSIRFGGTWTTQNQWLLTITGRKSGAIKTLSGKTKILDTTIATWNGTADNIFFQKEICDVSLSFTGQADTMKSTVEISGLHNYQEDGIVVHNFEISTIDVWPGTQTNGTGTLITEGVIPQGDTYLNLEGSEPGNAWYIAGLPPFQASELTDSDYLPFNDADTATTYINFFVRGNGYPETFVTLQTKEDDNENGTHEEASEDSYTHRYQVTGTEWKKVSIPLSALTNDDAAVGNNIQEISKITSVYVMLFSAGTANPTLGCDIDFIILTQGAPL